MRTKETAAVMRRSLARLTQRAVGGAFDCWFAAGAEKKQERAANKIRVWLCGGIKFHFDHYIEL